MRGDRPIDRLRRAAGAQLRPQPVPTEPVLDPEVAAVAERLADPIAGPEIRYLLDVGSRREARDRHAMSVLLASVLRRDAHTIDVGAHSGAILRDIVRVAPEGRHLAFEPIPELARRLQEQFPLVTVRNAALSDTNGTASFVHVESAPEFSGLKRRSYGTLEQPVTREIPVTIERLDDVLPEGMHPSFLKIDVEGAEMQVLLGARETLRRFRPTIVFEHGIGASENYGYGPDDVHALLVDELDLRIYDLDGVGPYTREQFQVIFPEPVWNFVAVP